MENNTLAVLIAVILMGTMAVSMILTTEAGDKRETSSAHLYAPFPDTTRSEMTSSLAPN